MNEPKTPGRMGRPVERKEEYRRTIIELPVSLADFLTTKPNRTKWIIQAIREKQEREKNH
jgi:hypothetical protein